MQIMPTMTFADCPQLDLICVPGGAGMNPLLNDAETLDFIRRQAKGARYVTSVCTGALVLGAAGLLKGKRAATHWMSREMLSPSARRRSRERVVIDGNVITGGGVTAGIDFALTVAAEAFGPELAQAIQLGIEYDPHPPFDAGSPERADAALVAKTRAAASKRQSERQAAVDQAAREARRLFAVPAACGEPRAQMLRHRRHDAHRLLVLADRHHDLARMQLQAGRVGTRHELDLARAALARLVAVDVVAEDRKAHRGAMHAQLMRAPGDRLERKPADAAVGGAPHHLPLRHRGLPVRIGLHPPAELRIEPAERHVDDAFVFRGPPSTTAQ